MSRRRIILLVDDNADDVELTLLAFEQTKLVTDIIVAKDGEDALDYLFATGSHAGRDPERVPDLVLLDLNLPKIDGLDVLKRMRTDERTRLVPVVILTSSKEEQDVLRSYDLGANSFVQKPVDFAAFIDAAHHLGLYWLVLNESPPVSGADRNVG